jgi:hypothetical protein
LLKVTPPPEDLAKPKRAQIGHNKTTKTHL